MKLDNGLTVKEPKYKNEVEVLVVGDHNDADYTQETTFISVDEFKRLRSILKKLKSHGTIIAVNDQPIVTDEEVEEVQYLFPSAPDSCEIHSIESIDCWFLDKETCIRYEITL